jgi:hypothetical protein
MAEACPGTSISQIMYSRCNGFKAKIPMARFLRIGDLVKMVAWIASPACGFAFDRTGGRAAY